MEAAIVGKSMIKVAAICGSLRKASFNHGLLRSAMEISKESISGLHIDYIDIAPLPMLNTDLEVDGKYPLVVQAFRQKILEADSYLFASPEYNYSVTGKTVDPILCVRFGGLNCDRMGFVLRIKIAPLKNAIDWASRPTNVWANKAAAIVSAGGSFGGGRSQYHLRQIGVYLDLHFINKPEFYLNAFQPPSMFDSDGNLIDAAARERLKQVLLSLKEFTLRIKNEC